MNSFFNEQLLIEKDKVKEEENKNKWMHILRDRLHETQMYEEYMKYQETLKK